MSALTIEDLARICSLVGLTGGVGGDEEALALWDAIMQCTTDLEMQVLHDIHAEGFLNDSCGNLEEFRESLISHRDFVLPYLEDAAKLGARS